MIIGEGVYIPSMIFFHNKLNGDSAVPGEVGFNDIWGVLEGESDPITEGEQATLL